jgi:hypothetical protein
MIINFNKMLNLPPNMNFQKGLAKTFSNYKNHKPRKSQEETKSQNMAMVEDYLKLVREVHFNANNSTKEKEASNNPNLNIECNLFYYNNSKKRLRAQFNKTRQIKNQISYPQDSSKRKHRK